MYIQKRIRKIEKPTYLPAHCSCSGFPSPYKNFSSWEERHKRHVHVNKFSQIPGTQKQTRPYALSLVVAALMAGVSLAGLLYPESLYPIDELRSTFVPNDVINLVIGLPVLLGSLWLAWLGNLPGLLFWPGALVYVLYTYIAYVFWIPSGLASGLYLALVLVSAYIIFDLLKSIDKQSIREQLSGNVPVRTAGWVLLGFGLAFILRAFNLVFQAVSGQSALPVSEFGVTIADLVISTLWIAGGILLLRHKPLGYVSGLGLLFVGSMLFVGLIMFLLLQPVMTDAPLALIDILVVSVMGLICSIPFVQFLRGVIKSNSAS